jgi:tetratricopeptide (TPR) repeat protein
VKSHPQDGEAQSSAGVPVCAGEARQEAKTRIAAALAPDDPGILTDAGEAYERMGDHGRALEYIKKALQHGYPPLALRSDPSLQNVVQDPALRALNQ